MAYYIYISLMVTNIYEKLGKNIKKYRKEKKYTQQKLAEKTGIGLNFLGKIEVAYAKPSFETIIKISQALDISLKELFDFKE